MELKHEKKSGTSAISLPTVVSLLALLVAVVTFQSRTPSPVQQASSSALDVMRRTKTIQAGYSGFRPYTIIDPTTHDPNQRVTGFCADMLSEIARRENPPWTIEWHKVTFETLRADMESGRFDVFADAVYQTIPRATDFAFTIPYSYFGVAVALVRRDDTRFKEFTDLDRLDITIALAEGWTSTEFARQHLTKPTFKLVAVGDDPFVQLQEVLAGRADVALQDVPTVVQFARAHADAAKALWVDRPPTRVPAGFMIRQGQWDLLEFLNTAIRVLEADATLAALDKKWQALSEFPEQPMRPGAGLHGD